MWLGSPEYGINYANIAEISNMPNAKSIYKAALTKKYLQFIDCANFKSIQLLLAIWALGKIIKVKAVSPSPFYDGKYHPPLFGQFALPCIINTSVR